ncbi:MAG: ABC transporter permease [Actinomycetales bacterium]
MNPPGPVSPASRTSLRALEDTPGRVGQARHRGRAWQAMGALALVVGSYLSLSVGAADLTLSDLLRPDPGQWQVITSSRIPRLAAILLAGSALSVAGLIMQRLTQNRFVSPSTSGSVEAAVLGVLVATMLVDSPSLQTTMVSGIVCSIVAGAIFMRLLDAVHYRDPIIVALVGLMYGGVIGAVTMFLALRADLVQFIEIWTTGSFSGVLSGRYEPLYLVLAVGVVGYVFADRFTVVGMGRDVAVSLGLSYRRILYLGLFVACVMSAVVVVVVGVIPFLGLIVPNLVSLAMGDNLRHVLPVTALVGAGFVLACDVLGRVLNHPYEIPVATIAGSIGGIVFIWLVLATARGRQA